ncbi:MAG: aspartyl/asparaginyl beta-hydroxylase domain-containing protein [Chitinophaga sp.]|uniref:aspartyl/asparaginyl beta-hydroxylase domain-containing protein n=1 Tax=Chitinophaga sp. TaxID=1869181 RepID=UPI0025B7D4F9|nr:aspartyl/asparaginyl beta-hydroxylase domain-containing protein [Chitinophaga sp.]MBV8253695.1 aspartyl/asparaginyl beta-hydroxylase domain-containing protein [Chitinophaga sp.]
MKGNNIIQLPFHFDVSKLQADLINCEQATWQLHFNTRDYDGEWTAVALRSGTGHDADIYAHPSAEYQDTDLLDACPYFREVINTFKCPLDGVRLLKLESGSVIKPHCDLDGAYEDGFVRIHIPVITHPDVVFMVDGERVNMQPGQCWYANFSKRHSVENLSPIDRVHLVIDARRNEWTDELFLQAGYDFHTEKVAGKLDRGTTLLVIAELERNNNPANQALIAQLKASL